MRYRFARWFFGLFGLVPIAEAETYAWYDASFDALGASMGDRMAALEVAREATRAGLRNEVATRAINIGARLIAHGFTDSDIDQMIINHYRKAAASEH